MLMLHSEGGILHNSAFVLLVLLLRWLFFFSRFTFLLLFCSTFGYPASVPLVRLNINARLCQAMCVSAGLLVLMGMTFVFFFFLFSAHYKSNLLSRVCVLWGGAEVSMLITKTNRLLPLSEEGMSLRVVSSLQHKPVGGSNTWFLFIVTHGC